MANSADPGQLASSEANWFGSTLFAKAEHNPGSAVLMLKYHNNPVSTGTNRPEQTV